MNTKGILIAAFVALISAASVGAQEYGIDFDGSKGRGFVKAAGFKAALAAETTVAAPEPARAERPEGADDSVKIRTVIKNGDVTREEQLTCKRGFGKDQIADCKKSDAASVSAAEVNTLALRQYLSPETLKFVDLLNQNKHSYTNQSGPMTFSCEDECARYVPSTVHLPLGVDIDVPISNICEEWTHSCTCTAGC